MPPKKTSQPGCFTRLVRWGLGGIGIVIAFGVVANLLPSSEPLVPKVGTPEAIIEALPLPTAEPTATSSAVESIPPAATEVPPVVEVLVAATQPAVATVAPMVAEATPIPATDTPLPQTVANRDANLRGGPSMSLGLWVG